MYYVYVLTNDLLPGLTKLGSATDVQETVRQIRATMPGKSVLEWSCQVDDLILPLRDMQSVLMRFSADYPGWYACPAGLVIDQCRRHLHKSNSASTLDNILLEDKKHVRSVADLGAFCREWRQKVVFTQKELADHADVHVDFIADLENGLPSCSLGWCLRVANLLGIDLFAVKR